MRALQRFEANQRGRDFVAGDIHGQFDVLWARMREVRFDEKTDRLFSVGDLIDRGPKSAECLALADASWFHPVCGNHEMMLRNVIQGQASRFDWIWNGGGWDEEAALDAASLDQLSNIVLRLPLAIEVALRDGRKIGITHARSPSDDWNRIEEALQTQRGRYLCLLDRYFYYRREVPRTSHIDLTVHGHSYVEAPCRQGNAALIDRGAGCLDHGSLTSNHPGGADLCLLQLEALFDLPQRSRLQSNQAA